MIIEIVNTFQWYAFCNAFFTYVVFIRCFPVVVFFVSICFFMRVFFRAFFKMRLMRTGISLAPFSAN